MDEQTFPACSLKNGDHITVNVIAGQALNLYYFVAEHKIYEQSLVSHLDDFTKELILNIIQSKDFLDIRDFWLRDYVEVMAACVLSLNYSDDALPTNHYIFSERERKINYPSHTDYYHFWHHLNHMQISNFVAVIEYAIDQKDSRFYDTYNWQVRHLMSKVGSSDQLTASQKRAYIGELLYRTQTLDSLAVENQLMYNPSIVSHIEIEVWIKNGWTELYRGAMYHQSSLLKSLVKKGSGYHSLLDEFFLLGISICNRQQDIEDAVRNEVLTVLLETGLKLYDNKGESAKLKYELQYQLQWLFRDFMQKDESFKELNEKFEKKIQAATEGFDYYDRPDF